MPGANTGSRGCRGLIRQWLTNCRETHHQCRKVYKSSTFLPCRLLDLVPQHTSLGSFTLVDGSSLDASTSYACLSHCWGSYKPLKLTQKSQDRLRAGLPLLSLPSTFYEAGQLCLDIGIRYLWVDSLCIFQDSDDDWNIQASQMRDVYKFSALTIAAAHAPDALTGLFYPRDPNVLQTPTYISKSAKGSDVEKCVLAAGAFDRPFNLTPLTTRAWAFQVSSRPFSQEEMVRAYMS